MVEEYKPTDYVLDSSDDESSKKWKELLTKKRIEHGKARPEDFPEPEDAPLDEGVTLIHKSFGRRITVHPGNIAKKSGSDIRANEAEAMSIAHKAGLLVPRVHGIETTEDGKTHISMDYIPGEPLSKVWKDLSTPQKQHIVEQLGAIIKGMREIPPPPNYIGACAGNEIRDARRLDDYTAPACTDEAGFNEYLLSSLQGFTPEPLRAAIARRLEMCSGHRVVLSHCDIAPRNVIVRDGNVVGLIDWEAAGWYPEWWDYVKFFSRTTTFERDWRNFADVIFGKAYPDELLLFMSVNLFQLG